MISCESELGRILVLDVETTGLNPAEEGDRIIEIGIVEIVSRQKTGTVFHEYVDPGFEVPEEAYNVHGLDRENLIHAGNSQSFPDIAENLISFINGSMIVAHNANFDMSFLDFELSRIDIPTITSTSRVFDTLSYANVKHPYQRNNLNSLCKRYGIDISSREEHGALLDADLLADAFLAMTKIQKSFTYSNTENKKKRTPEINKKIPFEIVNQLIVPKITNEEKIRNDLLLKKLKN